MNTDKTADETKNSPIGKTIKDVSFLREPDFLGTRLEFEDGSRLTITMYRKDVPWTIAIRKGHVAKRWTGGPFGFAVVCHASFRDEEKNIHHAWRGGRLDEIPKDDKGFRIVVNGETWVPSIEYLTPQGVGDLPTEYFQMYYGTPSNKKPLK